MRYIIIILFFSVLGVGCSVVKPEVQTVPTYVHIDSFKFLNPNPDVTGSASHAISTAWVFYNNNSIGIFDLPCTFPVMAKEAGTLEVAPGITVNGVIDNQGIYSFYTIDTFSFTAEPAKTITHLPVTQYAPAAKFPFIANFDLEGSVFTNMGGDGTIGVVTKTQDATKVFEGNGSGYLSLTTAGDSSINWSNTSFPITAGTSFCEFDFKGTMPFYVGLVAISGTGATSINSDPYYLTGVYPSNTWQKFYLALSSFVADYPADSYQLVIKANLPSNQANGYISLDNIKIVSY